MFARLTGESSQKFLRRMRYFYLGEIFLSSATFFYVASADREDFGDYLYVAFFSMCSTISLFGEIFWRWWHFADFLYHAGLKCFRRLTAEREQKFLRPARLLSMVNYFLGAVWFILFPERFFWALPDFSVPENFFTIMDKFFEPCGEL